MFASERNMRSDARSVSEALYRSSSMIASSNPLSSRRTLPVFCRTTSFRVSLDSLIHQSLFDFPFCNTYPESIFLLVANLSVMHFVFRTLCSLRARHNNLSVSLPIQQRIPKVLDHVVNPVSADRLRVRAPEKQTENYPGRLTVCLTPCLGSELRGEGSSKLFQRDDLKICGI